MILVDILYIASCIVIIAVMLYYFYMFMDKLGKLVSNNKSAITPTYPWYYMPTWVMDAWGETFPICLRASSIITAKITSA